ncbi:ParA family protein [Lacticaseibacillus paracasei]|uniref:ParA family protein n=1 Tax=Lacticaseibacillus paracasei TaxID=1597 RepID=UPI0025A23CDC|nr:ParA family protein [Lacticaseibacillus paracasei]MDM7531946.1 ParA family protein [Lacticaseibacillus paracasei]
MTAKVISIINMKGGVGKTTLTKEIGFHLSFIEHKRVLLIDTDPQANLTQSFYRRFNYRQADALSPEVEQGNENYIIQSASINNLYKANSGVPPIRKDLIVDFPNISLSLIPGDLNTVFMEVNTGSADMSQSIVNYLRFNEQYDILNQYDYVLIDCPPTYSAYTIAATLASDAYLIPVRPDEYSILGITMLNKVVSDIELKNKAILRGKRPANLGVIFTDITDHPGKGISDTMAQIRKSSGLSDNYFFRSVFLKNNGFFKSLKYFVDLSNSTRSKENLTALIAELSSRIGDLL